MRHVNIDANVFDAPEFSAASLEQIGIWLRLYAFCARQENSGIITTAGSWTDAHCQRLFGCGAQALHASSPLWHLREGGCLSLFHYNLIAEEWAKRMRKTARIAGMSRSEAKVAAARKNGRKGGAPRKIIPLLVSSNSNNPT